MLDCWVKTGLQNQLDLNYVAYMLGLSLLKMEFFIQPGSSLKFEASELTLYYRSTSTKIVQHFDIKLEHSRLHAFLALLNKSSNASMQRQ